MDESALNIKDNNLLYTSRYDMTLFHTDSENVGAAGNNLLLQASQRSVYIVEPYGEHNLNINILKGAQNVGHHWSTVRSAMKISFILQNFCKVVVGRIDKNYLSLNYHYHLWLSIKYLIYTLGPNCVAFPNPLPSSKLEVCVAAVRMILYCLKFFAN